MTGAFNTFLSLHCTIKGVTNSARGARRMDSTVLAGSGIKSILLAFESVMFEIESREDVCVDRND